MKIRIAVLVLLPLLLGAADSSKDKKKQKPPEPTPLDIYIKDAYRDYSLPAAAQPAGSMWSQNALFSNLAMDVKASRVDDIVTITVAETFSAVATGDVKTQRQSTVQSGITAAAGIKKATSALANLANANSQSQLQGQGETSRGAVLTANLSARVTHVLPNGYLVIEGTKRVQVSSENQVVTVRGVIRPVDLDPTNTVTSNRIAQMEIQVNGKGVVNDSIHRPNFLYRLILGILPF
ncbi:MAG TPA: flagellar basal body L-ring protein FlgH [Bryobacteraceae bacterium]|jgi:flagellar L-ring protein precursor FlgH|nr:flagellar basal body L-ring protein FlgH [Bryobacteraceae bacterium]